MKAGIGRWIALGLVAGTAVIRPEPGLAQATSAASPAVTQTAAAATGRLDGLVTDQRGAPLASVAVTAQGASLQFAISDERGRFSFDGLAPGPYLVRAALPGYASSKRELVHVLPSRATWQGFRLSRLATSATLVEDQPVLGAGLGAVASEADLAGEGHDHSALAWRLRHLKRSVLRDEGHGVDRASSPEEAVDAWLAGAELGRLAPVPASASSFATALGGGWLPDLPFSAQVQLLTASEFDSPGELFSPQGLPAGVAYIAIGAPVGQQGHWSAQVAIAQGDLSSWTFAGEYAWKLTDAHLLDVAVSYGLQRYEGSNPLLLAAVTEGNRDAGALTVTDRWTFAPKASLTVGTSFARYGYLDGPSMWSPMAALRWGPVEDLWLRAVVSQRMTAPGAEEFVPSPVGGLWVPSQRTFSALPADGGFRPSLTRHVEVALDREVGAFVMSVRGFRQAVDDQIVTLFGLQSPDRPRADLGHYFVANGGDFKATGWGVSLGRLGGSRLRGEVAYALSQAQWIRTPSGDTSWAAQWAPSALRPRVERIHDVTTTVETDVKETATRVLAVYRLSTGFSRPSLTDRMPGFGGRFHVQVSQRLPFLDFTAAEWEVLVAVRNLFREATDGTSIYDELLVVRPPKRLVGGVLVRF